jgi:hypothetical protein
MMNVTVTEVFSWSLFCRSYLIWRVGRTEYYAPWWSSDHLRHPGPGVLPHSPEYFSFVFGQRLSLRLTALRAGGDDLFSSG